MLLIHAHFQPPGAGEAGGLVLWAEDGARRPAPPPRAPTAKRPERHPFAAEGSTLEPLLRATLPGSGSEGAAASLLLWLPTRGCLPEPSPQLVVDWPDDEAPALLDDAAGLYEGGSSSADDGGKDGLPTLSLWRVDGRRLTLPSAVRLLVGLDDQAFGDVPVQLADDTRFWQTAGRLVLETLAAQKVVPAVVEGTGSGGEARWLPVLDDAATGPRLKRLAAAMPAVCRAGAPTPDEAPHPEAHLEAFLTLATDALVRAWLGSGTREPVKSRSSGGAGDAASTWLAALVGPDGRMALGLSTLAHFAAGFRHWLGQLFIAGDRQYRVALRLEEPVRQLTMLEDNGPDWRLHYLLQAQDDPSLLVPAAEVWRAKGSSIAVAGHRFAEPQERLLGALGYAARLSAPVRRSLRAKRPQGASLSTEEAHEFLRQAAPVLDLAGFGLIVPPWWQKPGSRLGLRLVAKRRGPAPNDQPSLLGLDELLDFRWQVALGEEELTRSELESLVRLKAPLVELRGQWVELNPAQVEAAIRFWALTETSQMSLAEIRRLEAGLEVPDAALPLEAVDFEGPLAEVVGQLEGERSLPRVAAPPGLEATLRPYQAEGLAWLNFLRQSAMGGILADDMGLGKTIQLLCLLLHAKNEGELAGPTLLVAPTSVVTNWAREAARFTPSLRLHVHQGADRLPGAALAAVAAERDLVVTSYAVMRRDEASLAAISWYGVVLDEAQQIKNAESRQAQVARSLPASMRFALTGTPVENRLAELWSIMHFLAPGYLGSQATFRRRLALPIERHGDRHALNTLRKLTAPFILRRLKTDPLVIQDLPEKLEVTEYAVLTPEQVSLYEAQVREAMDEIGEAGQGIARKGLVLAMLLRLKQICNHPLQFLGQVDAGRHGAEVVGRSGKLSRTVEILEEVVDAGDRALVFTQYAQMGELLRATLQEALSVPVLFLHGALPAGRRDALVRRFQDEADGPPIFVLSLKAGGTGLNLTRANHVVHYDRWWNPAVENQATDRAFRIGQTRNVLVHKFVCTGTLEERIDQLSRRKEALAKSVVGDGEGWLTELTNDELADLVALRREALVL